MAITDVDLASTYFMQRLAAARQGQKLSASMQFDLARSPMDDDELERVVDQFRDSPRPSEGWGLSSVLNEVLSSEPKRIPIDDLKALQKSLIGQGYAPPDAEPNGVWDPSWYAHFRRFDRDNYEEQRAGKHWYSAPVNTGMRTLTNTLPSRVFQGIVGAAKGTVLQAPETAERLGALGGAAAGAGLGTLIAPGIGTLAGGALGAGIGFLADLFTEDEGEEGQSFGGALLDSLSPWEEYRDNPKAAWEDLGFVLTAASLISGAGAVGRGVSGGMKAIQAARAPVAAGVEASALPAIFGGATGVVTRAAQPGLSWAKAAMLPSKAAAETELGAVGTILRAAAKKKALLSGTPGKTAVMLQKYSPIAFAHRLGPKIALDVFGGVSQAQMGGRLFGGIGQGSKTRLLEAEEAMKAELGRDLNEEELQNLEKTVMRQGSTIEKSIANAPRLESGVEIPLLGDMVDLAAFMFYPQRLLPFSGHKAAVNAYKAMGGADHLLLAYAHSIQKERKVGIFDALKLAREEIDPLENTRLRMEFGLDAEAHMRVSAAVGQAGSTAAFKRGAVGRARADAIREIRGELTKAGKGESETLRRVMALSEADPTSFEAWLQDLNVNKRGLSRLRDNREANDTVRRLERQLNHDKAIVAPNKDGGLDLVYHQDTRRMREVKQSNDLDIMTLQERIKKLERDTDRLEKYAERGAISPELSMTAHNGARLHRMEIEQLKRSLGERLGANTKELREGVRLAPARLDFQDRQTLLEKADVFDGLRDDVVNAPTPQLKYVARQRLSNYASQLESEGLISSKLVKTALPEKPGKAIGVALRDNAKHAAARFDVPQEFRREFGVDRLEELGYKLVETGEDVIFPDEIDSMLEITGVGAYTKRAAVMESLGLSLLKREDQSIGELMALHKRAELGDALKRHEVQLSPQAAMERLYGHLDEINHGKYSGATLGPLRKGKTGKIGLYKVDSRDLSVEEIFTAFEDVPGFTFEAAQDVYGALRKGSALGAELKFLKPADTFRELGRAMRINGAPGFSDLLRTYHAEVPTRLNRQAWRHGALNYKPEAELARSPQRKRFEVTVKETADSANITEGQRNLGMALMDSVARAQVKLGRFESVDDFYGHVDARFAEKYVESAGSALFKRVESQPSFEDLRIMARAYEDTKEWYEESAKAISELPLYGKHMLADGREISDQELFVNILAAVSPQKAVRQDVLDAWDHFKSIKRGDDVWKGTTPAERGMLDDILRGRTIDTWGPARTTRTTKKGTIRGVEHHGRQKVENFYQNLVGDLNRVTNDGWMAKLFGYNGEISLKQYDDITEVVKQLADDLGWYPAHVQAALWAAKRDEFAGGMRIQAVLAEESGNFAEAARLRAEAPKYEKATIGQYTDKIFAEASETDAYALMQRVQDDVMGMTQFGPDFSTVMRFFRTADFSTLVHENAHLLRQIVSDEDMTILERAYGVRGSHTPEGSGEDLRNIAAKYHEQSGIPADRGALGEYADVDEARAMRIADAYEATKASPRSRATKKAYKAFIEETMAQYRLLVSEGYQMIPWAKGDAPYKGAAEFIKDARDNKRNFYFKTLGEDSFGKGTTAATPEAIKDNPLLAYSGVTVKDSAGNEYPQTYNDIFRTVHDLFGHAKEGVQTGARGEENAWRQHARMYSREARKAMTTETRGQNSWVNYGKHLRQEGRVPRKGEEGFVPLDKRPFAEQKVMLLPDEFSEIDMPFSWPREAEEAFARDAEKYILAKLDPGHSRGAFDAVKEGVNALWASMRPAAVETNRVPRGSRQVMDRYFGDALALAPETRTLRGLKDVKSKQVIGGAVLGGVAGGIEGEGLDFEDIANGALYGAAGGLIGRQALKRTYGYLPDALARMNTALRYTMSLTFDAGRISEQNMIAMMKFNLRPMWNPKKSMMGHAAGWRSPYTAGKVQGEAAWRDVVRFWDEINGTNYFVEIDDLGRRMFQRGMLGFSPREWEAAQAFQLYQRGWGADKIREAVTQIGRYGTGRTAAEKTANFVVFPFSFSKKLLTTLGDFVLQHPGRNLLLHEGLRRYQESEYDDKAQDFLQKNLPFLEELKGVNNLVFGLSPGRFFLAGLADHRTGTAKAAQLLSSFFVPSGAATTLAQAAGNTGDWAINAFVPLVITGESLNKAGGIHDFDDIMRRYIPFMRELDTYFLGRDGEPGALGRQLTVLKEGADPYYQFSAYQDELRAAKAEHEPLALAMGYSSVDGLLQSDIGAPVSDMLERQRMELNEKYPTGFRMSQEFTNTDNLDAQAIMDLSNKDNRTAGEDHILEIMQHVDQQKHLGEMVGLDTQLVGQMIAQSARSLGMKYMSDPRFLELWDRFMLREYGPLRRVA